MNQIIHIFVVLLLATQSVVADGSSSDSLLQVATSGQTREAALAYKELARSVTSSDLPLHITYTLKGIEIARHIGDRVLEGNLYMNMGVTYDIHDQFELAIAHYDTALAIFSDLENVDDWLASIHLNYGAAYYYANLKSLALQHWLIAYEKCEKNAVNPEYGLVLNNIANIYQELGKLDNAIKYCSLSMEIKKSRGDTITYLTSLLNLGKLYCLNRQHAKSLESLHMARSGFESLNQRSNIQSADIYLAQAYLENHEIRKAAEIIFPLMDGGLPKHRASRRIEGFLVAGDVATSLQDYKSARRYYDSVQQIMDSSGVTFDQEKLYEKASYVEFKLGNPIRAYELLNAKVGAMKKAMERDRLLLEQEMQVKFNTLQKEQENMVLQSENTIKDLQITKTTRNFILALIGIVLISAFTLQVYLNRRRIQKLNRDLAMQKGIISKSLKEKEILLKEIHHRVKNNLQVVSSLLGIQSRRVKDAAAIDALKEGRSRVQSMSLIHQDLYSKDNLTGIEIRSYFKKLAENIFLTYNLSPQDIQMTSEIDPLILDVDTVIPLGLILNELITNALKYAFPDGKGKIHVAIQESSEGLRLVVKDNGVGISTPAQLKDSDSFGYDLINSFVEKLDGELSIKVDDGTEICTLLKTYQKAA